MSKNNYQVDPFEAALFQKSMSAVSAAIDWFMSKACYNRYADVSAETKGYICNISETFARLGNCNLIFVDTKAHITNDVGTSVVIAVFNEMCLSEMSEIDTTLKELFDILDFAMNIIQTYDKLAECPVA